MVRKPEKMPVCEIPQEKLPSSLKTSYTRQEEAIPTTTSHSYSTSQMEGGRFGPPRTINHMNTLDHMTA